MRKLMWFTLGFGLAALAAAYFLVADFFLIAGCICIFILALCLPFFRKKKLFRILAVTALGCAVGFSWLTIFHSAYLSLPRKADGLQQEITVYATDYSRATDYGSRVDGFLLLNEKPYFVTAYLPENTSLSPGDRVTAYFQLGCTLPGCSKNSEYNRTGGTFLVARSIGLVTVQEGEKLPIYGYPAVVRRYITNMIDTVFPADVSPFARALLLGDTETLDYETDTAFKISGIRHIIAVSGLHVSILFSLVFLLGGKRNWLASLIGLPVLLFFAAVAGFSPSIVRACVMHGLMAIGLLIKKEYDPPAALSFAVLIMLLCNPWTVANVGFQLSVGCIIGILLLSEPIRNWMMDPKRLGKAKGFGKKAANFFATSVSVSASATVIVTPLCAYYFGMVSLVSVLTNLLTLWVVTYIFYGMVIVCLVGVLSASVSAALAWLVAWPMRYVLLMAKALASFPLAAVYTDSIYVVIWLVLSYILLAVYLLMKKKRPLIPACCSAVFLCIALFASWMEPYGDECRVTVLDVGQGQCILLQSEGKQYLVDCGGDSDTAAADLAASTLLSQGIDRLDGMILTHFDADHAAGALYLLSRVPADRLYLPISLDEEGYSEELLCYAEGTVHLVDSLVSISYGESTIQLVPSSMATSDNESGLCVLFQTKNCDILITGDRNASGEKELMEQIALPELEVLIVGHHGSKYSTCEELLAATTPEYAIISVSADNSYGHPTQEVLERLEAYGCIIYRTDRDGTVIYRR